MLIPIKMLGVHWDVATATAREWRRDLSERSAGLFKRVRGVCAHWLAIRRVQCSKKWAEFASG
jgi:hypothetical protein